MLHALKMQAMYNANQSNPKSRITTAKNTNPPEMYAQQNAIAQQINTIVKGNANFTLPDAPTGVIAEQHNGYFDISWTPPIKTGGTVITGYSIQAYNCYSGTFKTFVSAGAGTGPYRIFTSNTDNPSTIQVDTTRNGTRGLYTFNVAATNIVGVSDYVASSIACQLAYMNPDAPALTSAVAGFNGTAELTWTAPAQFGGLAVAIPGWTYRISVTPAGGSANTSRTLSSSDETVNYTVTGLTNGTSYTLAVRIENTIAPNEDAVSAYSNTFSGIIPGAPLAPQNVTATDGRDREVPLTWLAAETPGDSPITSYTILARDVLAGTDLTPPQVSSGAGTSYTYTGLTNGRNYTFRVRATNASGTSPYSSSAPGFPCTPPSAPRGLSATFESDYSSATLTWLPPVLNGGISVSDYRVQVSLPNQSDTVIADFYLNSINTTCTISAESTGWSLGDVLKFKVSAKNIAGDGPFLTSVNYGPPGAPASVQVFNFGGADGTAMVVVTNPTNGNITPITGFIGIAHDVVSDTDLPPVPLIIDETLTERLTITGLTNGRAYKIKVAAVNYAGQGPYSPLTTSSVTSYTYPDSPTNVTGEPVNLGINVNWEAPEFDGGRPILDYTVRCFTADDGNVVATQTTTGLSSFFDTLTNGTSYYFQVKARNLRGDSEYSVPSSNIIPGPYPGIFINSIVSSVYFLPPTTGRVSWTYIGTITPTSFEVTINDKTADTTNTSTVSVTIEGPYVIYNAPNLTVGHTYTFRIRGIVQAGPGPISQETALFRVYDAPLPVGMPTVVWGVASPNNGNYGVTVSWTPNTEDPNTGGYQLIFSENGNPIGSGYTTTGSVTGASTSIYTATSMNINDYNGTTYKTIVYGPNTYNMAPKSYDVKVVGLTPQYAYPGTGTFNTNGGNHWITY
jgi:titin